MAHRLTPLVALVALLSLGSFARANADEADRSADAIAIRSATSDFATALARYYGLANSGAIEAYAARSRARGIPIGRSERCRLPSERYSTRPTVVANPPVSARAIAQRKAVVTGVGTFLALRAVTASGAEPHVVTSAERDLLVASAALRSAASAHAQGDLFIEDLASEFDAEARDLTRRAVEGGPALVRIDATVRKLLAVLATDVTRQRVDTEDAMSLASRTWTTYSTVPRQPAPSDDARERPFCSEPPIFERRRAPLALAPSATRRLDAVASADPLALVSSLAALDDRLDAVGGTSPSPATDDTTTAAVARFARAAHAFAETMRRATVPPLRRR